MSQRWGGVPHDSVTLSLREEQAYCPKMYFAVQAELKPLKATLRQHTSVFFLNSFQPFCLFQVFTLPRSMSFLYAFYA